MIFSDLTSNNIFKTIETDFPLLNYFCSVFQTKVKFKNIIENICENIKNQLILKPSDFKRDYKR